MLDIFSIDDNTMWISWSGAFVLYAAAAVAVQKLYATKPPAAPIM